MYEHERLEIIYGIWLFFFKYVGTYVLLFISVEF